MCYNSNFVLFLYRKTQKSTLKNSILYSKIAEMFRAAKNGMGCRIAFPMFRILAMYKSLSMIQVAVKAIRKDKGLMSPFFLIKKVLQGIYPQLSTEII